MAQQRILQRVQPMFGLGASSLHNVALQSDEDHMFYFDRKT